jgi:bacteriorhodopsin
VAGWLVAAGDALFRAEERPGIFAGTFGMVLLLIVAGIGGLTIAGALIWVFRSIISATVLVIILGMGWLGWAASNRLHVTAAGALNRLLAGLVAMLALYAVVWSYFPPP